MPGLTDPLGLADVAGLLGGGLGASLNQQRDDQVEEEKRKKRMSMNPLSPLNPAVENVFGQIGVPGAR